jgi:hypothetical protein
MYEVQLIHIAQLWISSLSRIQLIKFNIHNTFKIFRIIVINRRQFSEGPIILIIEIAPAFRASARLVSLRVWRTFMFYWNENSFVHFWVAFKGIKGLQFIVIYVINFTFDILQNRKQIWMIHSMLLHASWFNLIKAELTWFEIILGVCFFFRFTMLN